MLRMGANSGGSEKSVKIFGKNRKEHLPVLLSGVFDYFSFTLLRFSVTGFILFFLLAVYRCIRRTARRFRMCDWKVERMQSDSGISHLWSEFAFDLNYNWWLVNELYDEL